MNKWLEDEKCTACGACVNVCPKDAILLKWNANGFACPEIDNEKCINCNLCNKTCPVLNIDNKTPCFVPKNADEPKIYAAWSLDEENRYESTSGGVFTEFARRIVADGGYVCGAVYNEKHLVEHAIVNDEDGLIRVRQSKYIQSDIGYVYREIAGLLKQEKVVLFCGSPCQVAGLYAFLGRNYDNLYTVDFICRGANSPKAYQAWLDSLENEYGSKVSRVWFKNKERGWNCFSTRVEFEDGQAYSESRYDDKFIKSYLERNLFIRPSCSDCRFKGIPRPGDITVADFWAVSKELDQDKGTSMVVLNNAKGESLFEMIKPYVMAYERNYNEALKGNPCLETSTSMGKHSAYFFERINSGVDFKTVFDEVTELIEEENPLLSVVILAFAKFNLKNTLTSIMQQRYKNTEILVADLTEDGYFGSICDEFEKSPLKIGYYNLAGLNRNDAINEIVPKTTGKYVNIIEAGDTLMSQFSYSGAIEAIVEANADIICYGYQDKSGGVVTNCGRNGFDGEGNSYFYIKSVFNSKYDDPANTYGWKLSNRIFRREVLFTEGEMIPLDSFAYNLSERQWQLKLAMNNLRVIFNPTIRVATFVKQNPMFLVAHMNFDKFFDSVNGILYFAETMTPRAFKAVCDSCMEYEIEMASFAKFHKWETIYETLVIHIKGLYEEFMDGKNTVQYCIDSGVLCDKLIESDALLKKNKAEVDKALASSRSNSEWQKNQIDILKKQHSQKNVFLDRLRKDLEWQKNQIDVLKKQRSQKTAMLETTKKSVEWQKNQLSIVKQQRAEKTASLNKVKQDREWLKKQLEAKKGIVEEQNAKILALQQENAKLKQDREWLKNQNAIKEKKLNRKLVKAALKVCGKRG